MANKRLIIEMGMGVDQHARIPPWQPPERCATLSAPQRFTRGGVGSRLASANPNEMIVDVQVAVPFPDQVRQDEGGWRCCPLLRRSFTVEDGGNGGGGSG